MMPHQTFQIWKKRFLPFVILMVCVYLTLLPLWQSIGFQPTFLLIILYHWFLYRPDLLPIEQLILISLIQDGIYAYPLGFSALRLLISYTLLATQKRTLTHQKFVWVWGGFALFTLVDTIIFGVLLSCIKQGWIGMGAFIPGLLITASFYPISIWVLDRFSTRWLPV